MKMAHITQKQKTLLTLISCFEGKINRLKLMKLGFLLTEQGKIYFYDFLPYKYGPYSFELEKDLSSLQKKGYLIKDDNDILLKENMEFPESDNKEAVISVWQNFGRMGISSLLDFVYQNYPYYGQNSTSRKIDFSSASASIAIYTTGYQNFSIDHFFNTLISTGIKNLIDIRNRPLSYKYGFNGFWMKKYLSEIKIKYVNIPEVGIEKQYRNNLDKQNLWEMYRNKLERNEKSVNNVARVIQEEPSVMMCFETNPQDCHRLQLAKKISSITGLPVKDYNSESKEWKQLKFSLQ
jgi:hypothetical protein